MHAVVPTYMRSDCKTTRVMRSDVDLLAIASLHVDGNEADDWVVGFGDSPLRFLSR